jgi:UDP-3-O-[3-hydroxymyristoyl] N-acetylglucosamine deacetylase
MGIDNALIELDSPEMPGMDGSAKPFVEKFLEAGVVEQSEPKKFIKIKKPIEVALDGKFAMILPHPEQKISYTISFDHPVLNRQHISFNMNEAYFTEQIAAARTFGFLKDAEELRKLGLAKGVSLDNSIVIGEKRILNERLRYSDEFVRHKVLDFIGDLSLMGRPIIGHLIALKSGHQVNTLLCGKVKEREDSWELVDGNEIGYLCPGERIDREPVLAAEAL